MGADEVIAALHALTDDDKEQAHIAADEMIVNFLRFIGEKEVADAYDETQARIGFWYA